MWVLCHTATSRGVLRSFRVPHAEFLPHKCLSPLLTLLRSCCRRVRVRQIGWICIGLELHRTSLVASNLFASGSLVVCIGLLNVLAQSVIWLNELAAYGVELYFTCVRCNFISFGSCGALFYAQMNMVCVGVCLLVIVTSVLRSRYFGCGSCFVPDLHVVCCTVSQFYFIYVTAYWHTPEVRWTGLKCVAC